MKVDGQSIQALAALLAGLSGFIGTVAALFNHKKISDYFKSRMILIGEKEHLLQIIEISKMQMDARDANAKAWEGAWGGAQDHLTILNGRITVLEKQMLEITVSNESTKRRFNSLLKFTLDVLIYMVALEDAAGSAGVAFDKLVVRFPAVPPELHDDIIIDRKIRSSNPMIIQEASDHESAK